MTEEEKTDFQKDLGRIRRERGISVERVALLVRVSPPRLRLFEHGIRLASREISERWCQVLGVERG
jgi:transcriptional regulator with XRE-family HTH domain